MNHTDWLFVSVVSAAMFLLGMLVSRITTRNDSVAAFDRGYAKGMEHGYETGVIQGRGQERQADFARRLAEAKK